MRWKRRRRGWVGFAGTSRAASAWVTRSSARVIVRGESREWLRATGVAVAMCWVKAQLVPPPEREAAKPYLFVHADGKVEARSIPYAYRDWKVHCFRSPPNAMPVTTEVIFRAFKWAQEFCDPSGGRYGKAEVIVYVEDGADHALTRSVATRELKRIAHFRGWL